MSILLKNLQIFEWNGLKMPKEKLTREELGKQMMETTIIKSNKKK